MIERKYLGESILLCGESDGINFKRTFIIDRRLNDGASVVCYEAHHENSIKGVLKEFYPQDAYVLERDKRGQLVPSLEFEDAYNRFLKSEMEYIEPYEMLLDIQRNSDNQDLATFIPVFEIYHGCDETGKKVGTTYIWTPEPKLETFDKVCDEIHKYPKIKPEHKLVTVLTAIQTLTKCICSMHCAGLIHRDIKPSNFGFINRGNETLTQTLSMFDINSVCSVFKQIYGVVGTEGYLEPEAGYASANNQTDIYSIGATLFHAIIVTDEIKTCNYLYQNEFYDSIRQMVDESKLIQASEANSHPRLRYILTEILKKSLCDRSHRYANCEEMLEDLEKALYYALPSEIAMKNRSGEKWILADVEKSLDKHRDKNSYLNMQYHLYQYPLYQCCLNEEKKINVMVIGFGNYGQKFLDACLQAGQIRGKQLDVMVVSDDVADKEIYLSERPQLEDFFNIDGSLAECEDTYGDISFEMRHLNRGGQKDNLVIMERIISEHYNQRGLHYIFVALGDESLNYIVARACNKILKKHKINCIVSYACENNQKYECNIANFYPLYVNRDVKEYMHYKDIERMAYNTHLVWEKNLNRNNKEVKAEFRKKYNYDSCVSNVLSLKYKLYSVGIDLEKCGFNEAARLFSEIISKGNNQNIKNELIWIEHRRWNTEKICLGWRRIRRLEDCISGVTKDEKHKRHVCLLRSKPEQKLADAYRQNKNYDIWDNELNGEFSQLDELEQMSVELHRMYAKRAKELREQYLLFDQVMQGIRNLIEGEEKSIIAFGEWCACIKDIGNGDISKVHLYNGLRFSFLNALDNLSEECERAVYEHVKAFEAVFYPVLASAEYRDWKQDDAALIENIPFVLTYTENAYMVIPFAVGDTIFNNVSAATVVNPKRIIYLCFIENQQDVRKVKNTILRVAEYMEKKNFKALVDFVFLYNSTMEFFANNDLGNRVKEIGNGRIRGVKSIIWNRKEIIPIELVAYFKQREVGKCFFAVEKNMTTLSGMLQENGFYNLFSNYQFDSESMKFNALSNCDMLNYIAKKPYITVADMLIFCDLPCKTTNQSEFFNEYQELWDKYCEDRNIWIFLCNRLREHTEKHDVLALFRKSNLYIKNEKANEYTFLAPAVCKNTITKIISSLKELDILEQGSCVNGYTTDSCKVTLIDRLDYRAEYENLFSNIYSLILSDAITICLDNENQEIKIMYDHLTVRNIRIEGEHSDGVRNLMCYLNEKGYVINLKFTSKRMSFTYATRQIKELFTKTGKILDMYTYHKAKELGRFDDVVSCIEINWRERHVKGEFGCVMTKGFCALFVVDRTCTDQGLESYGRLVELAERCGIHSTVVLIDDTYKDDKYINDFIKTMHEQLGNKISMVDIWKSEEIHDIGNTLLKVINRMCE